MIDRKEDRYSLAMNAQVRARHDRRDGLITNLSQHGCRVCAQGMRLPAGQKIILRPAGLESLLAMVRWSRDGEAGIEFERPLHLAVVEHLQRLHPDEATPVEIALAPDASAAS